MIISVLVARPLDGPFSYRCPDELSEELKLGGLVMVPFGRQELIGCIWSLDEVEAEARLAGRSPRAISGLLDGLPELPAPLRSLIERLARYYHCPLGEALKLALPHIASQKGLTLTGEGRALKVADSALPQSLKMAFEALRALMLKRPLRAQEPPKPWRRVAAASLADWDSLWSPLRTLAETTAEVEKQLLKASTTKTLASRATQQESIW